MPVALSAAWTTTITDHDATLKTLRSQIEALRDGTLSDPSAITVGEEAVKSFKRDIRACNTALRGYIK
jgi:hypothetical protein